MSGVTQIPAKDDVRFLKIRKDFIVYDNVAPMNVFDIDSEKLLGTEPDILCTQ